MLASDFGMQKVNKQDGFWVGTAFVVLGSRTRAGALLKLACAGVKSKFG